MHQPRCRSLTASASVALPTPDLLAACERWSVGVQRWAEAHMDYQQTYDMLMILAKEMRAAIAKAKGGGR